MDKRNTFKYPDMLAVSAFQTREADRSEPKVHQDDISSLYVPETREEADALVESAEAMVAEASQRPGAGKSGEYVLAQMRLVTAIKERGAYEQMRGIYRTENTRP